MNNWIILIILYALVIGFYTCSNKKAVNKTDVYEVFAFFSLITFFLVAITSRDINLDFNSLAIIFIRTIIIVASWIIAGSAIKKMPISLYAVLMLSKILFTIALSVLLLKEKLTFTTFIGGILVITGLFLVNKEPKKKNETISIKYILMILLSCFLSSVAAILDKKILLNVTSSKLQFWFLLSFTIIMWIILLFRNKKIDFKNIKKNYWIPLMAITLVVADKFLFMANEIPESKVTIMTIVRQISTIEVIILGKLMFKEKKILRKLLCSIIVILGIIITLI